MLSVFYEIASKIVTDGEQSWRTFLLIPFVMKVLTVSDAFGCARETVKTFHLPERRITVQSSSERVGIAHSR